MAKNLVNGTNIVIEENADNINMNLSSTYTNNLNQNISNSFKNNNIYSTTETIVGKWINNKPIYRKTIVNNPTTYGEQVRIDLNISNPDLVWVDKSNSFLISNGGATFCGIGADGNQAYWFDVRQVVPSKEYLYCTVGESIYSNSTIYVTINYTKTTD